VADLLVDADRLKTAAELNAYVSRQPTGLHLLGAPRDAELTASKRLAARLTRCCPDYGTPGYGAVAAEHGLPCAACAAPTDWVAVLVDGCARCATPATAPARRRAARHRSRALRPP